MGNAQASLGKQVVRGALGAVAALGVLYLVGALGLVLGGESLPLEVVVVAIVAAFFAGVWVIARLKK